MDIDAMIVHILIQNHVFLNDNEVHVNEISKMNNIYLNVTLFIVPINLFGRACGV
jgi:hypothetical protein